MLLTDDRQSSVLAKRAIQIGREVFDRSKALAPSVLNSRWWEERLMQWSMTWPDLKARLFRLVDVLPSLPERSAVLEHLKEYLEEDGELEGGGELGIRNSEFGIKRNSELLSSPYSEFRIPHFRARLLRLVPPLLGSGQTVRGRLSAAAVLRAVRRLARRFIAGETIDQAIETVVRLRRQHQAFSLDLLGEKVLSEPEADRYAQQYLELIRALTAAAKAWPAEPMLDAAPAGAGTRTLPRVNLSIKLSSLYSQFDPLLPTRSADAVLGRLRPILREARARGAFIHVDMESYEVRDLTLDLFDRIALDDEFADWRDLGIVIQAYLLDSSADLDRVINLARRRGTPLTVRLVKGAYWDYENVVAAQRDWPVPVFSHKAETDANYERLTDVLLANADAVDSAFASHNVRSLAYAMAAAEKLALPPGQIEFQMLYGMGEAIHAALVERGQRVRVYAPFGELIPGMAYLIRRLLENTANESFLRQSYFQGKEIEQLLADPADECRGSSVEGRVGSVEGRVSSVESRPVEFIPLSSTRHSTLDTRPFRNVPDTDFAKEDHRVAMHEAIQRMADRLGRLYQPIVAGQTLGPPTGGGVDVVARENPAQPSQVVARVQLADQGQADAAVAAAEQAQAEWESRPVRERAELLHRLGDLIESQRPDLAALEVFEAAKQWREADADISEAVDYCRYYASQAIERMGDSSPRHRDVPGERNIYRYRPRGVGVIIAPWNFPLAILCGMSTAAVAAGNAVILKPSEFAMAVAGEFALLAGRAGFPPGVFNYLPCRGSTVGDYLVGHPGVDFIAFTGSRQVGLAIYAKAAANPGRRGPKHMICEMGGKNAIIVDADADLDEAVRGCVVSAFGYNGQKCSACSRVIVVGSAYERFLDRLVESAGSLTIGPPADSENFMGPVIDRKALAKIREYIEIGRSEARCVLDGLNVGKLVSRDECRGTSEEGGTSREESSSASSIRHSTLDTRHFSPDGYYLGPTIFADVPPAGRIAQEEIFGPVLAVIRAGDFDEAIRLANGVDFALTGGVYSRSPANVERAKAAFRVGNLYINRKVTGALVDRQPFGGFKFSGLGTKAGGPDYLLEFLIPQTITENTLRHGFAPEATVAK